MSTPIRIPLMFYDDHEARALPTPTLVKRTKRHGWVRMDDPAMAELISDARYYADPTGMDCPGIDVAARALLRALEPTP